MISNLALRTAIELKRRNPENIHSVEKLHFALHMVYNIVFTVVITLFISLALGHFWQTSLVLFSSYMLRRYSGGFHMSSSWSCIALTTFLANMIPFFSFSSAINVLLTFISGILAIVYAPSRIDSDTNVPTGKYFQLKFISVIIICSNFIFLNSALTLTFFLQGISLIHLKERGEAS